LLFLHLNRLVHALSKDFSGGFLSRDIRQPPNEMSNRTILVEGSVYGSEYCSPYFYDLIILTYIWSTSEAFKPKFGRLRNIFVKGVLEELLSF
jgi:hypothetical protein